MQQQIPVPTPPAHFKIGFGETPDFNQVVQVIEMEEPETEPETVNERNERIILPSERKLMLHFVSHYAAFLEHIDKGVENSFLLKPSEKIHLYDIYCKNWGQTRK